MSQPKLTKACALLNDSVCEKNFQSSPIQGFGHQIGDSESLPEHWQSGRLEEIFSNCFEKQFSTILVGNADEPYYCAAKSQSDMHIIYYRHDYFSSALHEIAHWCIAGVARRKLDDYGYWYEADGRNAKQQAEFQRVELKPQAIELAFSIACKKPFRVSIDNLLSSDPISEANNETQFTDAVNKQYKQYCQLGFPPRAAYFLKALNFAFSTNANQNYNTHFTPSSNIESKECN